MLEEDLLKSKKDSGQKIDKLERDLSSLKQEKEKLGKEFREKEVKFV